MANWLSMGINTYKKIEYGVWIPAFDELKIIAEKPGVNPSYFLIRMERQLLIIVTTLLA